MRRTITTKFLCCALLLTGCATQLQAPPSQEEVLEDSLPETTEIRAEWAAPADDIGQVDDGWLTTFEDAQLEALVAEALDTDVSLGLSGITSGSGLSRFNRFLGFIRRFSSSSQ